MYSLVHAHSHIYILEIVCTFFCHIETENAFPDLIKSKVTAIILSLKLPEFDKVFLGGWLTGKIELVAEQEVTLSGSWCQT